MAECARVVAGGPLRSGLLQNRRREAGRGRPVRFADCIGAPAPRRSGRECGGENVL